MGRSGRGAVWRGDSVRVAARSRDAAARRTRRESGLPGRQAPVRRVSARRHAQLRARESVTHVQAVGGSGGPRVRAGEHAHCRVESERGDGLPDAAAGRGVVVCDRSCFAFRDLARHSGAGRQAWCSSPLPLYGYCTSSALPSRASALPEDVVPRVREALREMPELEASLGAAAFSGTHDLPAAIARADQAMYEEKARNRFTHAHQTVPQPR